MSLLKINIQPSLIKIILRIFIILIAVAIGLIIFIAISMEKIINNNLSDYIYKKSDSIYRLEFKHIDISYKHKSLSFSQVTLHPDFKIATQSSNKYYEFETNSLVISGIRLNEFLRYKKFSAESIKANNPKFRLSTGQDVDFEMFSTQKTGLGDSIKLPYIKGILIDTILVTDAKMKIDTLLTPEMKIPKVNLEILQFKLGGVKTTNTPFPFDVSDISLKIQDLQEGLSDKIHIISVEELSLSLLHSKISAKNISLRPYVDSLVTLENQYWIKVPDVEILCHYVQNFYTADTIPIEKLTFHSPEIVIKFGEKVSTGTPLNQINLYKLVENDFAWISIEKFAFEDAHLKFIPSNSNQVAQEFENLDITFTNFRIDPQSYAEKDRILSAKDLLISMNRFTLNHNDKVHQLIINDFLIDTHNKKASLGLITFKPVNTSSKLISSINTLVDVQCKGAGFKNVDFGEVYHHQVLPMDELTIHSPEIVVSYEKNMKQLKDNDISLIFAKTKDYIKGIYVKRTIIDKGKLNLNYISDQDKSGFFSTNFRFGLNNLSIDSSTVYQSDKIFFANNFDVKFSEIRLQLADDFHRLMSDSIILSSKGKAAEIYNLRILPIKTVSSIDSLMGKGQQQIFDVSFPKIEIYNTDLHKAFFQKELLINDFNVINPTINIDLLGQLKPSKNKDISYKSELYPLISDYLFSLRIGKMRMKNGQLNITQFRKNQSPVEMSNSFSVEMTNFEIDSLSSSKNGKIFFSDDVDLVLKDYSFALADGVHKVDAKEIGILSSQDRMYINNARMYPDLAAENIKKLPVTSFATLPSVEISGADIHQLFNTGNLTVSSLVLAKPAIKLLLHDNPTEINDTVNKAQFVVKGLNALIAGQITIKDGTVELASFNNMKSKTFATSSVDFSLFNLKIENDKNIFKTSYDDLVLSLKNASIITPGKLDKIEAKQITYKLSDKLLKISNLSFKPGQESLSTSTTPAYRVTIPDITFEGLNVTKYYEKKEIIASAMIINDPTVEMINSNLITKNNNTFDPYHISIYNDIKDFIEKIEINNVEINNISISLIKDSKQKRFSHLNVLGSSFLIDNNSAKSNNFLSFGNIRLEILNRKGKTEDGFYNYGFEKLVVDSKGDFSISGLSLLPTYPEAEFNRRKIYQDDYITIPIASCSGNGLNIKRLLEKNEISISKASFAFDRVEIYRNNHFPADPDKKMDMPQKGLRNLKGKFIVDTVTLSCKKFNYRELEPQANSETQLFFTNIDASVSHITNLEKELEKDNYTHLDLTGRLMNSGELKIKLNMNIPSPENKFNLKAECNSMPLSLLNPITEPSLKLSIKEGFNDKVSLNFEANEDSAHGEMNFAYSGLKISLLTEKDGQVKEDKFASFLANTLAVKSDNPRPGKTIVPVIATLKRDKDKSFISYCWQTTLAGIKNTFGIKDPQP